MNGLSKSESKLLADNGFDVNLSSATATINGWDVFFFKKKHGRYSLYNISFIAQEDAKEYSKGDLVVFDSNRSKYDSSPKSVKFLLDESIPYFKNK